MHSILDRNGMKRKTARRWASAGDVFHPRQSRERVYKFAVNGALRRFIRSPIELTNGLLSVAIHEDRYVMLTE